MNRLDAADPSERPVNSSGLAHLIWLAFGMALASVFFYLLVKWFDGDLGGVFSAFAVFSSALVTMFVGSVWAVFGPGSYLKRLLLSYLLCAVVGLGHLAGFAIFAWDDMRYHYFLEPLSYVLLGIVPVLFAAQIPLWFFRFFFGWQFTFRGTPPTKSFSLSDIFVFTFLAALGFAAAQMAVNLTIKSESYDPLSNYEEVRSPSGRVEWVEVVLTDQKLIEERRRKYEKQVQLVVFRAYAAIGAASFGISLVSLPFPLFMLRTNEKHSPKFAATRGGWVSVYAYACLWLVLAVIIIGAFMPLALGEVFLFLAFLIVFYASAVSIAFDCSRRAGYELTSPRLFRQRDGVSTQTIDSD